MEMLSAFQNVARKHGFVDAEVMDDGNVLWLKRPTANAEDRMCIDSMTHSATLYWATIPWQINSKTFRAASVLEQWLAATPQQAATEGNSR